MRILVLTAAFLGLSSPTSFAQSMVFDVQIAQPKPVVEDIEVLPTPFRVMARSKREVSVATDFVNAEHATQSRPLLSVRKGFVESLAQYEGTDAYQLEQRFKEKAKLSQKVEIELSASLHEASSLFFELGGQHIFGAYLPNRILELSVQELKKSGLVLPSLWLDRDTSSLENLEIRVFHLDPQIPDFFSSSIRRGYESPEAYYNQFGRSLSREAVYSAGLSKTKNARTGFVMNTCIRFENLGSKKSSPEFDQESLCWVYDITQSSQVLLPITPGPQRLNGQPLRSNSIVEWVAEKKNGTKEQEYALFLSSLGNNQKLTAVSWKPFQN